MAVAGEHSFTALAAGESSHYCGLTTGGTAYCWGGNFLGQLGNGAVNDAPTPTAVAGGHTFASLGLGGNHSCAGSTSGTLYCWGYEGYGQLGDGSVAWRSTPTAVIGGITFGPGGTAPADLLSSLRWHDVREPARFQAPDLFRVGTQQEACLQSPGRAGQPRTPLECRPENR